MPGVTYGFSTSICMTLLFLGSSSIFEVSVTNGLEINRETTGVSFQAYVKRSEWDNKKGMNAIPDWKTYSQSDIKTMLRIVNRKFTRIVTGGAGGAKGVQYQENVTYYDSNAMIMTAEVAALINREANNHSLTVFQGIWVYEDPQQRINELLLALESCEKANAVYPGTVRGFVFHHFFIGTSPFVASLTLEQMKQISAKAKALGLKMGTRQICNGITEEPDQANLEFTLLRRRLMNESDFVICEISPAAKPTRPVNVSDSFEALVRNLLVFQNNLEEMFPGIEVMGQTGWPSSIGGKEWENKENLQEYWEAVNRWSAESNMTMWLYEAFDNPWKIWHPNAGQFGWWKLTRNSRVNKIAGYIEKVNGEQLEPEFEEFEGTSVWIYIGIGLGVFAAFTITLITIMVLCARVKKLEAALTKKDIHEFMFGMSNESATEQEVTESALRLPYDKSFEISKDKFFIDRRSLLGAGQFGIVYKAIIHGEVETQVALKMAKEGCQRSGLKGLLSEIKILAYLGKHDNIVYIVGAYTAELQKGLLYLATELCTLGNLQNYLRNCQKGITAELYTNIPQEVVGSEQTGGDIRLSKRITFKDMIRWSIEIACGMDYLGLKHVIHADLSTRNVLLTSEETAKITDFGLSRRLYEYTDYVKKQQEPLPWRWMAIESLKRLEFSSKSDVWSYGITLWEIFSMGDLPYPGLAWDVDFVDSLAVGRRLKSPQHANEQVYDIMIDCWHTEPQDRPTFIDIRTRIGEIMENMNDTGDTDYVNLPRPASRASCYVNF